MMRPDRGALIALTAGAALAGAAIAAGPRPSSSPGPLRVIAAGAAAVGSVTAMLIAGCRLLRRRTDPAGA